MKHKTDPKIGRRAAEEILKKDCFVKSELQRLGLYRNSFYTWNSGECCPDARALQAMAECGYDVVYILTGQRTKGNGHETSGH